jgi:hypothetical protein
LALSIAGRLSSRHSGTSAKGQKSAAVVAVCLIALFAFNVGGQRDRAVEGVMIGVGAEEVIQGTSGQAELSARDRRELLMSWINVGQDSLPFGDGIGAAEKVVSRSQVTTAAHNTFATTFGQGGVAGLLISLTTLLCLGSFIRRRSDPFAIMGIVVVAGGLVLSYPGTALLVLPMGLADGLRAAQHRRTLCPAEPSLASDAQTDAQAAQASVVQLGSDP